jgi:hypothetical protein
MVGVKRGPATMKWTMLPIAGLLAACVLCGCQAPEPIEPQLYSRTPEM